MTQMLLVIDNYDSFTYNLVHFLGDLGASCVVRRNDVLTPQDALALKPDAIILSPGPCDPDRAGICVKLVRAAAERVPVLGVCLGHQAVAQAFGGKVVRAPKPMHGKMSEIHHAGGALFDGLEDNFSATRYHSLIIERETLPHTLEETAWTQDGILMGLRHKTHPVFGVQFHPESIMTAHGHDILRNFLRIAGVAQK